MFKVTTLLTVLLAASNAFADLTYHCREIVDGKVVSDSAKKLIVDTSFLTGEMKGICYTYPNLVKDCSLWEKRHIIGTDVQVESHPGKKFLSLHYDIYLPWRNVQSLKIENHILNGQSSGTVLFEKYENNTGEIKEEMLCQREG